MDIVFLGAGRLATQFAQALNDSGHRITAVYSRTMASAQALGSLVGSKATDDVDRLPLHADAYIVALKDSVLAEVLQQAVKGREGRPFFHTAGSVPMAILASAGFRHHGVIYPMQTFSKERRVDFSRVPLFIEGCDTETLQLARAIAASVSRQVHELASADRRHLHLAAVFACNFVNHCYALSAELLEAHGLPFKLMLPLIEETAAKVAVMHPHDAQTGPAVRYDEQVIQMQSELLTDHPRLREVYNLLSHSIHISSSN